jgi:hypothetical protein
MTHSMAPFADNDDPDYEAALEIVQKLASDNPMPRELKRQIDNWIEPQTVDTQTDHGDVMDCIEIAFPLIRDWLAEHTAAGPDGDDRV